MEKALEAKKEKELGNGDADKSELLKLIRNPNNQTKFCILRIPNKDCLKLSFCTRQVALLESAAKQLNQIKLATAL